MNKAVMIAIQPKWAKMIKDGTKTFEYRNYAIPKGTKVYLYECLGKRINGYCIGYCEECVNAIWGCNGWEQEEPNVNGCKRKLTPYHPNMGNLYEGTGKVVAEFVVGECWKLTNRNDGTIQMDLINEDGCDISYLCVIGKQGYTNQQYAHEITDLIWYDEPLDISEFVGWNKLEKLEKLTEDGTNCHYMIFNDNNKTSCSNLKEYCYGYNCIKTTEMDYSKAPCVKLTHPPQGKIYAIEREG